MLSADGATLITEKEMVERLAVHFCDVLNRQLSNNDEAIQRLPQMDKNPDLDVPPSEDEVAKAIKHMSSGKAPVAMPSLLRCSSQVAHLSFKS